MPRYPVVLLDADNTLFDFDAAEKQALKGTLESRGWAYSPESQALYGRFNGALWAAFDRGEVSQEVLVVERFRRLVEALGGGHDPARMNEDYLTALGECSLLLPGAETLCRALSGAGCRLALATNGVARVQWARLKGSPLAPLLEKVFISEEMKVQKPQAAFFDRALAALGVDNRSMCCMVGDGLRSDILGGNNAGIDTIWYNPRHLPGDPNIVPTCTAAGFEDILKLILGR